MLLYSQTFGAQNKILRVLGRHIGIEGSPAACPTRTFDHVFASVNSVSNLSVKSGHVTIHINARTCPYSNFKLIRHLYKSYFRLCGRLYIC